MVTGMCHSGRAHVDCLILLPEVFFILFVSYLTNKLIICLLLLDFLLHYSLFLYGIFPKLSFPS